jgi:hypothetical protein
MAAFLSYAERSGHSSFSVSFGSAEAIHNPSFLNPPLISISFIFSFSLFSLPLQPTN